jgi:hypothetical protein
MKVCWLEGRAQARAEPPDRKDLRQTDGWLRLGLKPFADTAIPFLEFASGSAARTSGKRKLHFELMWSAVEPFGIVVQALVDPPPANSGL